MKRSIPIKDFLARLESTLENADAATLRGILRSMALDLPPAERPEFLHYLESSQGSENSVRETLAQEDLLADAGDFLAMIEEELAQSEPPEYDRHGWGYDDEDSLGPYEEHLETLTDLFERVSLEVSQGNHQGARAAFAARPSFLWGHGKWIEGVIVAMALRTLAYSPPRELPKTLGILWQRALRGTCHPYLARTAEHWDPTDSSKQPWEARSEDLTARYEQALVETLQEKSGFPQRCELEQWLLTIAEKTVTQALTEKSRSSYEPAAELLAACREAMQPLQSLMTNPAEAVIGKIRSLFPRHRAFHEKLKIALR